MQKTKAKPVAAKIHAIVGSDDVEVKRTAAELAEKLKPANAGEFGLEVIDGAADNSEQASARIRSTMSWKRSTSISAKNAPYLSILCESSCRSRAKA